MSRFALRLITDRFLGDVYPIVKYTHNDEFSTYRLLSLTSLFFSKNFLSLWCWAEVQSPIPKQVIVFLRFKKNVYVSKIFSDTFDNVKTHSQLMISNTFKEWESLGWANSWLLWLLSPVIDEIYSSSECWSLARCTIFLLLFVFLNSYRMQCILIEC